MFQQGRKYAAKKGDYRVEVLCIRRTKDMVTFHANERDAKRYFGTKSTFTKRVAKTDMLDDDGKPREFVARLGRRHPGCDWCITDEEMPRRRRWLE